MRALLSSSVIAIGLISGCSATSSVNNAHAAETSKIVMHVGSAAALFGRPCVDIEAKDDAASSEQVSAGIRDVLTRYDIVPAVPCASTEEEVLRIIYNVGTGVCIDCQSPPKGRSGFALVALENRDASKQVAAAEWQYWGGGNTADALDTFGRDLASLKTAPQTSPREPHP